MMRLISEEQCMLCRRETVMQVLLSAIVIPDRVRKDLGDLQPLVDSMERCGQLNPITVTRDMVLIAGHRRCEAARQLGWRMIDATIVDGVTEVRRLEIELEENIHRKDFSPEELLEGIKRLDKLRNPGAVRRLGRAMRKAFSTLAFWRYFGSRAKKGKSGEDEGGGDNRVAEVESDDFAAEEVSTVEKPDSESNADPAKGDNSKRKKRRRKKPSRRRLSEDEMLGI